MVSGKRRSCDVCYQRKIRCDAAETGTTCDWCIHHNLTCTFTPRKPRSRKVSAKVPTVSATTTATNTTNTANSSLSSTLLSSSQSPPSISDASTPYSNATSGSPAEYSRRSLRGNQCSVCQLRPSNSRLQPGKTSSQIQNVYPGHNFGFVCLLTGIPHFSEGCEHWMRMRSGLVPRFGFPSFQQCHLDTGSPFAASKMKLPPRWAFDAMLETFVKSDLSLVFPLVDELLFEETAHLAYEYDGAPALKHVGAKACVLAFLTVVALNFPEVGATKYVDIDAFPKAAKLLVGECLEDTSLVLLQTYLLLFMFDMVGGRMKAAAMYNALACRIIFTLGGHQRPFSRPKHRQLTMEEREDRHVRQLFWMCLYFDKDISLRTGYPPAIDDDVCDLTLPEGYEQRRWSSRTRDPSNNTQDAFFPGDMRLTLVKSHVVNSLYGNKSGVKSDAELLRTIRELDAELENWRSLIPREFAPALSVRKDIKLASNLSKTMSMLHVEMHVEYHLVLSVIHSASGSSPAANTQIGNLLPGIQSSLDLSVEASRSTMVYLTAAADRIVSEAFWAFVFYPMSALMTLFFSILRNPRSEHVLKDLELIGKASVIIRRMGIHATVPFATEYLREVDFFVEEVHRIAKGAIEMANNLAVDEQGMMHLG